MTVAYGLAGPFLGELPGERTAVSLTLPVGLPFEDWAAAGEALAAVEHSVGWWLGDWWAYGLRSFENDRKRLVQLLQEGGHRFPSSQTCANAGSIARAFCETSRRREVLSFEHHAEVASLPADQQDELLDQAERDGLSSRELRSEVARRRNAAAIGAPDPGDRTCTVDDLGTLAARGARYGTVYADPPWQYDDRGARGAATPHYPTMTVDELCALPVRSLLLPDAHLHLWVTNGFLFEAPRLFEAWGGFVFKSSFVWAKTRMGTGNYWRNSHELLLTAVRGNATRFADRGLRSWLECDRGRHSAKPERVRSYVERASPGPYLELFARLRAPGWASWGDGLEHDLFHPPGAKEGPVGLDGVG